jgi:hypothetical protein
MFESSNVKVDKYLVVMWGWGKKKKGRPRLTHPEKSQ